MAYTAKEIEEFIPEGAESGASLALWHEGKLVFAIAGTKFDCAPGELFYMGVGGHRLNGEDLPSCASREAREELGVTIELFDSRDSWLVTPDRVDSRIELTDDLRPLSLFFMNAGPRRRNTNTYYIAIYQASLPSLPSELPGDEVRAVIALTPDQVVSCLSRRPTLKQLVGEGARVLAAAEDMPEETRLYPIGSAIALAHLLRLRKQLG